ncbi:DUF4139 domain-containing protein [Terasakiella sp.]|uniref:DUF4139 domain-containing protein n=1 Tax=Terasakiella sp. TaxID=2034861 RepID=UPI003AA86188
MSFSRPFLLSAAVLALGAGALHAETVLDQRQRNDLSLTLYQNGLGFVRDVRKANLTGAEQTFVFEDISTQLTPDSLLISGKGFRVLERRFDFDLLTPNALLEKSVGQTVHFRRFNSVSGKDDLIEAKILSAQGQTIIERDGRIEVGQPGQLVIESLPEGLRAKPALTAKVDAAKKGETTMALAYLSSGLKWHTSYSAELAGDGKSLVLQSWANLTNTSGVSYRAANLSLAAGQVNRQTVARNFNRMVRAEAAPMMDMGAAVAKTAQPPQALGAIHLYNLPDKVDLNDNETKQVALMHPLNFKSERELVQRFGPTYGEMNFDSPPAHPQVELTFNNTSKNPLPDGILRLYRRDAQGQLQFVGEDNLTRTPKDGKATLHPGESFDVTIERNQTSFERKGKDSFNAAYKIVIKNAKDSAETVRIEEAFPGQWSLSDTSTKPDSQKNNTAIWKIKVPAGKEKILTYQVSVRLR